MAHIDVFRSLHYDSEKRAIRIIFLSYLDEKVECRRRPKCSVSVYDNIVPVLKVTNNRYSSTLAFDYIYISLVTEIKILATRDVVIYPGVNRFVFFFVSAAAAITVIIPTTL